MKYRLFSFFRSIHAWSGVALALLLLIISITGVLLVWKQEYLRLVLPEARQSFSANAESLAKIATSVEHQFAGEQINLIEFPVKNFSLTKVTFANNDLAYVDVQGNMIGRWGLNQRWEEWLFDLHHRLLLGNLGLILVGWSGLIFLLVVITGLISFWPLRRSWREGVLLRGITRAHLLRSHRNLGVVEALPLLVTLITGVTLAFPKQTEKYLLEPFRPEAYSLKFTEHLDDLSGSQSAGWLPSMQRALRSFQGAEIRSIQPPNAISPYRIIGLQQSGEWNPQGLSKVYIDAEGGYMDMRIDSQAQPISERLFKAGYALHTGRLGLGYKLLLTFSGLIAAMICLLGFVSFIKKQLASRSQQPRT